MASNDPVDLVALRDPFRNLPRRTSSAEIEVPYEIWCHVGFPESEEALDYRLDLILASYISPFSFSGGCYNKHHRRKGGLDTPENDGSGFRILGTGQIVRGEGDVETFDMIFKVETGTGTGSYEGIGGSGWISIGFPSHQPEISEGQGRFVFDVIEGMEDQDDVDQVDMLSEEVQPALPIQET
ncbi:MAG: hypothetical protein Q9223_004185 [Gallowayella weberi]